MTLPSLPARGLIAEDEPLLAQALQAELALAWPELAVTVAGDGLSAVAQALALRPEVLFLDIRMPGLDGFEAAAELADQWPDDAPTVPFPCLVFVTAFDQYAVKAFETHALDYLLKPVQPQRLRLTVDRIRLLLGQRRHAADGASRQQQAPQERLEQALAQLRLLLPAPAEPPAASRLTMIQASVGNTIHLVPIEDVIALEAADKYVRVLVPGREYLIRTALRELLPRLDSTAFWQVHRGTVVRARSIEAVQRDEGGRLWLRMHGHAGKIAVSRLYAHLFKAM